MKSYALLAAASMFACIDVKGTDSATTTDTSTTDTTDTTDTTPPATGFSTSWGDSAVSLTITDGDANASYYWGVTENVGCTDCWTAEDCFMGYDLGNGTNLSYCHPVSTTGGSLSYGASYDGVVEGSTTLFPDASFSTGVTYIVDDRSSAEGPCWTWGGDTSYYNGYEKTCTAM